MGLTIQDTIPRNRTNRTGRGSSRTASGSLNWRVHTWPWWRSPSIGNRHKFEVKFLEHHYIICKLKAGNPRTFFFSFSDAWFISKIICRHWRLKFGFFTLVSSQLRTVCHGPSEVWWFFSIATNGDFRSPVAKFPCWAMLDAACLWITCFHEPYGISYPSSVGNVCTNEGWTKTMVQGLFVWGAQNSTCRHMSMAHIQSVALLDAKTVRITAERS